MGAGAEHPRRSTPAEDFGTVLATCVLLAGAGLDARAHALGMPDSFFTPWHAALYSGFAVTLAWITFIAAKRQQPGRGIIRSAPAGYEAAWVGLAMFAVGGIGDLLWHEAFGIEQDIAATFSPTHLLMFLGAVVIVTSPLRSAWRRDGTPVAPFTAVASTTLAVTITALVLTWLSPLVFVDAMFHGQGAERSGLASLLVTNVLMVGPPLVLLARWHLPLGSFTALWTIPAIAVVLANSPSNYPLMFAFLGGGLLADTLSVAASVSAARRGAYRALAVVAPASLWGLYFAILGAWRTIAWDVELWTGALIWASATGLLIAEVVLLTPRSR